MKKKLHLFIMLNLFMLFSSFNILQNKTILFSYCTSENGQCLKKCSVVLISGSEVAIGSYVKVYLDKELITEGYILKHVSGSIFILKNKADAKNPEICGGCCGGAYEINITKKQLWGC